VPFLFEDHDIEAEFLRGAGADDDDVGFRGPDRLIRFRCAGLSRRHRYATRFATRPAGAIATARQSSISFCTS
jgi:hypothetical protein